jgi:hypothetical protein
MSHAMNVSSYNQNGPLPKRTIEIKNVNFLNKYDILCIICMILYVFFFIFLDLLFSIINASPSVCANEHVYN